MESSRHTVIIALGANLGDPVQQVRDAIQILSGWSDGPVRVSSLWQSTPEDCPPGSPSFINAVIALVPRTNETPESLLPRLQHLEREFGRRQKVVHNEARPLDLDLVSWGQEVRQSPELTLPHPRAHRRRFVLAPLAELAPNLLLPGQSETVAELLSRAAPDPALRRWPG